MLKDSYSYYYQGEKHTLKTNYNLVGIAITKRTKTKLSRAFNLLSKQDKMGNSLVSQPFSYSNGILKFYTTDRKKALDTYFEGIEYQEIPVFGTEYGCIGPNNGIVIRFKDKTSASEAAVFGEKYRLELAKESTGELEKYVARTFLYHWLGRNPEGCFDVANEVWEKEKNRVEFAEPDFFGQLYVSMPNVTEPERNRQWALKDPVSAQRRDMRVAEAWGLIQIRADQGGFELKAVNIAIVDDGLHPHTDILSQNLLTGRNYTSGNKYATAPISTNDNHGSQIAGILTAAHNGVGIAGVSFGLANIGVPYCKVIPIRVSNNGGHFTSSSLIATGIGFAASNARIVNLSINFIPDFPGLGNITSAINLYPNTLFVCSAGNYYPNDNGQAVLPPATLPAVLTVAAHDRQGAWIGMNNGRNWGSRNGNMVDVCAPGTEAAGTVANNNLSINFEGTSAATAFVSGVAGLILAINPSLLPIDVITILKANTEADITINGINHPGPTNRANYVGAGRINAERAVQTALNGLPT